MISNPQVVRFCNEQVRTTADKLSSVCNQTDKFVALALSPEILVPLGITPEILAGENMPDTNAFPDDTIDDGAGVDGRPLCTRRKVLALIRVIYQLQMIKNQTANGIPAYTEAVAYALAVNPRM